MPGIDRDPIWRTAAEILYPILDIAGMPDSLSAMSVVRSGLESEAMVRLTPARHVYLREIPVRHAESERSTEESGGKGA